MSELNQQITTLLQKLTDNTASRQELDELFSLLEKSENEDQVKAVLMESLRNDSLNLVNKAKLDLILQKILPPGQPAIVKRIFPWKRIAVAVSITLILGLGSYFIFFNKPAKQNDIVKKTGPQDVKAPQSNRAMITLADGRNIYLDSADNGTLVQQDNINIIKSSDGKIVYTNSGSSPSGGTDGSERSSGVRLNTLSNPRGSKVIDMTLSDGSHVWLNAGSSITYPIAFIGSERKVSITGEAYFEVAHDKTKPFFVSKGDMQVEVLGTHFNVNAYDDEDAIRVTLLEGSVKVLPTALAVGTKLKPGQQALVSAGVKVVNDVNTEEVTAWKDNRFIFNSLDIKTIMRQLSRWYDVDVVYEGEEITNHFTGVISRDVNASEVFQMLQRTGVLKVRIEGKKVYIGK
ncbi:MAG: FecR domain-containing protein [Chitinophagaceae bacterium]